MAENYRKPLISKATLGNADTAGGILSWQNPHENPILIIGFFLDITAAATAACTADFGATATSGTTSVDNLIDGVDLNAATGVFDNNTDKGTNGKTRQRLGAGKWITGSKATGAAAGLAGTAHIEYIVLA